MRTHAAGELKPNPFGLCDVHGNVWEWVQDEWEPTYYGQFQEKPAFDPSGPSFGRSLRMVRGGGWNNTAFPCRSSRRHASDSARRNGDVGFRVSLAAVGPRAGR